MNPYKNRSLHVEVKEKIEQGVSSCFREEFVQLGDMGVYTPDPLIVQLRITPAIIMSSLTQDLN